MQKTPLGKLGDGIRRVRLQPDRKENRHVGTGRTCPKIFRVDFIRP
ncbi:MAG: hypothetical protein N3B10_06935 [Armatimonadetes bacterium]|nr:hypothetical protein [Armatimonadota bacterium]